MVGKIHTKESSNVMKEFKTTIAQALKTNKGVEIRNLERNLLAFRFLSVNDKEAVIKGCPRNFDRRLIVLNDLMRNQNPNKVDLSRTQLWVPVYEIPLGFCTKEIEETIRNTLGSFIKWDQLEEYRVGKSMRVRILMDITKPLRRGMMMKIGVKEAREIIFKYERLGNVCYMCGCLDPLLKECEDDEDVDIDNLSYEPWLRASPVHQNEAAGV